jgi:hypothetical protein
MPAPSWSGRVPPCDAVVTRGTGSHPHLHPSGPDDGPVGSSHPGGLPVGRFVLGFIVAIVLVIFIVAQCVGSLI